MTAPTPEQMRALADAINDVTLTADADIETATDVAVALRAAADQLEAVRRIATQYRFDAETAACIVSVRLDAILPPDTASQSDRIEDAMQRNWNRRYGADTAPPEGS